MARCDIPVISDEEVLRRYNQIKPLFKGRKVATYNIFEIRTQRDWNASCTSISLTPKIEKYKTISCFYKGVYPYVKYPTIAEIISQISEDDLRIASYFEVTDPVTTGNLKHHKEDTTLTESDNSFTKVEVSLYKIKTVI